MTAIGKLLGASVTAATLLLGVTAYAQTTDPAKKTAAAKKPPSVCKGLDQAACTAKADECQWITPKKGKQKPYCKLKSKAPAKPAPAKKDAAPK